MDRPADFDAFEAFSARLGHDPMRVQGPGGNTSIKDGNVMWIKASGTELADAESAEVFVAVDREAARAEVRREAGDGSCTTTILDPAVTLRPSIETTFHAALDWPVVAHTHSIATLVHVASPEGREVADDKLSGLPFVRVPYAKPGLPLTDQILAEARAETQVILLENHGLICCGASVAETEKLMLEVETRLRMPRRRAYYPAPESPAPNDFDWSAYGVLACDPRAFSLATAGSYYPDHVVFLGPALPRSDHDGKPPAILIEGQGAALRLGASSSQTAMLRCLADLLLRLPQDWSIEPIGAAAEAELLNWDAEKYRQALAARA